MVIWEWQSPSCGDTHISFSAFRQNSVARSLAPFSWHDTYLVCDISYSWQGLDIFSSETSKPTLSYTQPPIQWTPAVLCTGIKRPEPETDHTPPPQAFSTCVTTRFHIRHRWRHYFSNRSDPLTGNNLTHLEREGGGRMFLRNVDGHLATWHLIAGNCNLNQHHFAKSFVLKIKKSSGVWRRIEW